MPKSGKLKNNIDMAPWEMNRPPIVRPKSNDWGSVFAWEKLFDAHKTVACAYKFYLREQRTVDSRIYHTG